MAEISIVLPTYNRINTLPRAINSVLNQSYTNFELIVVDDASTDDTVNYVNRINDHRVRVISHKENQGGSAARNTGIKAANGNYIAFIDSDDEWNPNKLELQVEKIKELGEYYGLVYTGYYMITDGQRELGTVPKFRGEIFEDQLARDRVNPTSTVVVRLDCLGKCGLFDETLEARQDYDLWLRIARKYKVDFIRKPLVILHSDSSNRITENVEERVDATLSIINQYEEEISSFHKNKRREIMATQYFALARYCQKQSAYKLARSFIYKSLKEKKYWPRSWLILLLILFRFDTNNKWFIKLKNRSKATKIRWR